MICKSWHNFQLNTLKCRILTLCVLVSVTPHYCNAKGIFFNHGNYAADATTAITPTTAAPSTASPRDIIIGPCHWVIGRQCPDPDVKFFLYTRHNIMDRQYLHVDTTLENSNFSSSHYNPRYPTKIIIHGYNSDMFLHSLYKMREEYLARDPYNIIYVDWSVLAPGPCYLSAVHNTKHTGACVAQLVERMLEMGSTDIHVIGFSLGAQLTNYIARNLGSFKLPRITGLDPAMPLFITASADDKLDPTDAGYVDVIHTNALVQGKIERCGHADFYMNGGIMQPGCSVAGFSKLYSQRLANGHLTKTTAFDLHMLSAANVQSTVVKLEQHIHQRAGEYFLESIRSPQGFWGWACSSYISYLLGMCPATNYLVEAGEHIRPTTRGMYLVDTNDTSPYALGKWTDLPTLGKGGHVVPTTMTLTLPPPTHFREPLLKQIDQWNKLESNFNNLEQHPTPFSQDPNGDNWTYFSGTGTGDITNALKDGSSKEEAALKSVHIQKDQVDDSERVNWLEYRQNLSTGHVENSIFKVPHLKRNTQSRQPRKFTMN